MGRLSDMVSRGMQLDIQQEQAELENEGRRLQMDRIIRENVAVGKRTNPGYAAAWDKITDPNTPPGEIGALLTQHVPAEDVQSILEARHENQKINAAGKWTMARLMEEQRQNQIPAETANVLGDAAGLNTNLPPGNYPTSSVNTALTVGGSNKRNENTVTGAKDRAQLAADVRERASIRAKDSKDLDRELRGRLGDANNKLMADRNELTRRRVSIAEKMLDRGGIDIKDLVDMYAEIQAGNDPKFATDEQLEAAAAAAGTAWDAIIDGMSGAEAIALGLREHDIRPGKLSDEAKAAAEKFRAGKPETPKAEAPTPAVARSESTAPKKDEEAIFQAMRKKLGLADTPESRKRVATLNATRSR